MNIKFIQITDHILLRKDFFNKLKCVILLYMVGCNVGVFFQKQTVVGSNRNHPSNMNSDLFDLFVL